MSEDEFDYPRLLAAATLGLVRELLQHVEEEGLPGEHHFFLTFRTGDEGVELPAGFRDRFPDTMTVVLQNQFERLSVDDGGFSVDLRFGGTWERLRVPFAAMTAFLDPSVPFGLDFTQFATAAEPEPEAFAPAAEERPEPVSAPRRVSEGVEEKAPDQSADVLPFRPR